MGGPNRKAKTAIENHRINLRKYFASPPGATSEKARAEKVARRRPVPKELRGVDVTLPGYEGPTITEGQREYVAWEIKNQKRQEHMPVRFLYKGQNLNIVTGRLLPKGTPVIHQMVYWGIPASVARKIEKWLGVRAVFDKPEPGMGARRVGPGSGIYPTRPE
jgi:hypothetical protein